MKTLLIWDFDGVILNTNNNYNINFLINNSFIKNNDNVAKITISSNDIVKNIILTGRIKTNLPYIINILNNNNIGIIFEKIITVNLKKEYYNVRKNSNKYLRYKKRKMILTRLLYKIKGYKNFIVIDDTKDIIDLAEKLNFKTIYHDNFLKEIKIDIGVYNEKGRN